MDTTGKKLAVYNVAQREGEAAIWTRVGTAYRNRDGSLNVQLESLPVNGKLHIRDLASDMAKVEPF